MAKNPQMPILTAQLDATFQQVKALSQLLASLLQLVASLIRVPLLAAQIGTLLLALPFLTAQVITGLLTDIVGGLETLLGNGAAYEEASQQTVRTAAPGDASLGSFGIRRPAFLADYERRQEAAAPAPAAEAAQAS